MIYWQKDITEFYDPHIYHNMTFNRFLLVYKRYLKRKSDNPEYMQLYVWVQGHEQLVIQFIKRRFAKTLRPLTRPSETASGVSS